MKKLLVLLLLTSFAAAQQINYARMLSGVNYQSTVTSYTFVALDATRPVVFNSGIAVAVTLPSGLTSGFGAGKQFDAINAGAGIVTITCSGCTITALGSTGATLTLNQAQGADLYSDGTNYVANVYGVASIPFTIAIPGTAAKCMAYYPNGTVATINGDCSILTDANGNLSAKSLTTTDTTHAGAINFIGGTTPIAPAANQGQVYYDSVGNNFKAVKNLTLYTLCTSAGESGCGGTTGGTSGQIQYNNAGALGGFTASGDATINTSTGAVTVSKLNGTAFSGTNGNLVKFGASNTPSDAGFLASNVTRLDAANTGGASMTLDMSASSAFKVPASAGAAPTASAQIAYDTTANNWKVGKNGSGFTVCTTANESGCATSASPVTGAFYETVGISSSNVTVTANATKCWLVMLPYPVTTAHVGYDVTTADNTANLYDMGFYDNSGNLLGHVGATAGTTLAPSTGIKTLTWLVSFTLNANTRYYFCMTGNASTLAIQSTQQMNVAGSVSSTTTGGALNGTFTPPADVLPSAFANVPHVTVF